MFDKAGLTKTKIKKLAAAVNQESKSYPLHLVEQPYSEWKHIQANPMPCKSFRSREFSVQIYNNSSHIRITVSRTRLNNDGSWREDISWDDLQRLKRECGYGDFDAVEIYPADKDVVNVANMRHLWIMPEPLSFKWKESNS